MKNRILLLLLVVSSSVVAQTFTKGVDLYSKKKTAYITLVSGEEIEGNIKKVSRKKGQINFIKLKLENGDILEYAPDEVKYAFLPRSGFESFAVSYNSAFDATTWGQDSPEGERIKEGYAYFETEELIIKKKKKILLMQIVNPHFNKSITVYHDPRASESASVGFGGIKVAGGVEKSYYVKGQGDERPYRLKKKDYDEHLEKLFGDCDKIKPEDSKRIRWSDFAEHVYNFTVHCGK